MSENKLMYNNQELMLLKQIFAENEDLLKAVRNLFYGVEMTQEEKDAIKSSFSNPDVVEAVRHKIYGLNSFNTPIGQLSDFWMGLEQQIFGASRDTIKQAIGVKVQVLEMFTKAFKLLENPDGEKVSVKVDLEDELGTNIIARNLYMKAIDTGLYTILTIAGKKNETLEEVMKRLEKNSNK